MVDFSMIESLLMSGAKKVETPDIVPQQNEVLQFEDIMSEGRSTGIEILEEARPADQPSGNEAEELIKLPENNFMNKLEELHNTVDNNFTDIYNTLKEAQQNRSNPVLLLQAQAKLYSLSYDLQLSTKIAEKSNESVKTLFKQQ